MAVPPPPDKPALRRTLRARRTAFAASADAVGAARAIRRRLHALLDGGGPVAGYAAHRGEPDVLPFLADALAAGRAVALPHVDAAGAMSFADWHPDAALAADARGLRQPAAAGGIVPAVLLMPLVGFDRAGRRLGQGGGHYDRWCAAHPAARRIGIAWSVQEVAALPADPWDMPLDAVVTEREWIAP